MCKNYCSGCQNPESQELDYLRNSLYNSKPRMYITPNQKERIIKHNNTEIGR